MTRQTDAEAGQAMGAWIDGELGKDEAAEMERLAFGNESMRAQADRLRKVDALVRRVIPEEDAIPSELLNRLGLAADRRQDNLVDMAEARRARAPSRRGAALARLRAPVLQRIAAMLVLALGVGAALWMMPRSADRDDAAYRTLSDGASAQKAAGQANALVIFREGTEPGIARAIAGSAGAQLIGEPNSAGAWKAAIATDRLDLVLDRMRQDERVTVAEPIDGSQP